MASTEPTRIYKARPWLAERALKKAPETRYKNQLRQRVLGLVAPVVFLPYAIASGQSLLLLIPGMGIGTVHAGHAFWQLRKRPEIFFEKDSRTRALVADYNAHVAAGTWTGAEYRPTWLLVAPLIAVLVGVQLTFLLHTSVFAGIAAALLIFVGTVSFNVLKVSRNLGSELTGSLG